MRAYITACFRIKSTGVLLALSLFCLALSWARFMISGTVYLVFLIWNLVLAFIPWFIAITLYITNIRRKLIALILIAIWLLFFPNAPYILTDIIHLTQSRAGYLWFDFIIILTYSFSGLFYAYTSLDLIEKVLYQVFAIKHPGIISAIALYLSAYGIYLGRFLRWNSWDLIINMQKVSKDILSHVVHPISNIRAWFFSFLMGTLLVLFYHAFKVFRMDNPKSLT